MVTDATFGQGHVTEIREYATAKHALVKLPMLNYQVISGISHLLTIYVLQTYAVLRHDQMLQNFEIVGILTQILEKKFTL
jgi:hypothetical protein